MGPSNKGNCSELNGTVGWGLVAGLINRYNIILEKILEGGETAEIILD